MYTYTSFLLPRSRSYPVREARQPVMDWHAIFWWEIWEFGMSWRDAEPLGGVDKSLIYYLLLLLLLLLVLVLGTYQGSGYYHDERETVSLTYSTELICR